MNIYMNYGVSRYLGLNMKDFRYFSLPPKPESPAWERQLWETGLSLHSASV